jgi:transposase
MKIRVVKTASKASAVQVIRYQNRKRIVMHHLGSAHSEKALNELIYLAEEWIKGQTQQLSIFPEDNPNNLLHVNHLSFLGVNYRFFYNQVQGIQKAIKLDDLPSLLTDLVAIRIFEPASKLRSLDLLKNYFGIHHSRKTYYKIAPDWIKLKDTVEKKVTQFAVTHYGFNYDLLFYDVTTLYFETFEEDELRKNGFSKDNKAQQPQIVIGLMVSKEGFPVAYEVFSGNTFEGHTIIPIIKEFLNRNKVGSFTVVADAAMISANNINELNKHHLNFIVGARLANSPSELLAQIDESMVREDGKTIRIKTEQGFLICSFSSKRYSKDKYEMEKQIEKAKQVISAPSKGRKTKFTQAKGQKLELNEALIQKTKKLLGIKGYFTNMDEVIASNELIINRYHELYKVEQAFRMAKSDLETRPIFHFKEQPIRLHVLICFMALVVSKHIELKTGFSIRKFIDESKKIVDGEMLNQITKKKVIIKAQQTEKMRLLSEKLGLSH